MTNLMSPERAGGKHVAYLVNYAHRDSAFFAQDDATLLARYERDLAVLFPDAGRTIVDRFVFRAPFVEPIWSLDYARRKPPASVIPGRLYLASTAQVYPQVNSWNSCCSVVERMMPQFAAETAALTTSTRSACA
jgi:protoporphyrinogen oxidase